MSFRKVFFWTHLIFGATAGLVILVMSATGALLAFQPQLLRFADRHLRIVTPPSADAARLGPDELFAKVVAQRPEVRPDGITLEEDRTVAPTVSSGRETLYVNPYTGEVLGPPTPGMRGFFRSVTEWHRTLGLQGERRAIGRNLTGVGNFVFLGLALSGMVIWWPKTWTRTHLRPATVFQGGLRGKARDWNWHNVIGFWMWPVLLVLTSSGVVLSFNWANNLLYIMTGSQVLNQGTPPPASGDKPSPDPSAEVGAPKTLNELWQRAEAQSPGWHTMAMRVSSRAGEPVVFTMQERDARTEFERSQLTLNRATGAVERWQPYAGLSAGRRLRTWFRFSHTGEMEGIIGQFLAFLACVGGTFLVYTGFALALRRFFGWLARRRGAVASVAGSSD